MLKKLQRKFVMLTTSISFVVLVLIGVAINFANFAGMAVESQELLDYLIENNFKISEDFKPVDRFSREMAFTTRYFVVITSEQSNTMYVDTTKISAVSSEQAVEYADIVNQSGSNTGIIENYRYVKLGLDEGFVYIFLDIEQLLTLHGVFIKYSCIIIFIATILIYILSSLLSKKAVAPIVESYERQKSFITNVSHEFKTPLAIIKADNDVIEIDSGESEWTQSIKSQIERLNLLVEDLISLTKLDEQNKDALKVDFSLSDALNETINEFSSSFKNNDLNVITTIENNVTFTGQEDYVRKLFEVLTENAVKYSPNQSDIKIGLALKGNRKVFTIENACENLTIGKHNHWFDRFQREDKSRNSNTKGFGIGLSIAKAVCEMHGSSISAESKTGKEIIITVIF